MLITTGRRPPNHGGYAWFARSAARFRMLLLKSPSHDKNSNSDVAIAAGGSLSELLHLKETISAWSRRYYRKGDAATCVPIGSLSSCPRRVQWVRGTKSEWLALRCPPCLCDHSWSRPHLFISHLQPTSPTQNFNLLMKLYIQPGLWL